MPDEREISLLPQSQTGALRAVDFDIAGNAIRAYFDADGKLVFVVDFAINAVKPNVLLVINPVGARKWDDILVNDYGIDLETVRPKKDNKYQKLDVEYNTLAAYDAVLRAFNAGKDVANELAALEQFRAASARRVASDRLVAAESAADKARETIEKTNVAIADGQARIKELRTKLSVQRKAVGKEPTKQSASKILRTEAQLDVVNEKVRRAKKRLSNARRRLTVAEEDAVAARKILNVSADTGGELMVVRNSSPIVVNNVVPSVVPVFDKVDKEEIINSEIKEPKAEKMAEDEVKPLLDKDPEILDEEIAFKPIDFDVPAVASGNSVPAPVETGHTDTSFAPAPLSFTPPTSTSRDVAPTTDVEQAPVLDTITSIEVPATSDVVIEEFVPRPMEPNMANKKVEPVAPVAQNAMPEIAPAPASSELRPTSPITNSVAPVNVERNKPTLVYYIMLVALIILSIFTLWLYQNKTNQNVPDLAAVASSETKTDSVPTPVTESEADSPFVEASVTETVSVETTPIVAEPVGDVDIEAEAVAEPESSSEAESDLESVVETFEVETVSVTEPEPSADVEPESPFLTELDPAVEAETASESESVSEPESDLEPVVVTDSDISPVTEPVVDKPVYNVSQQDNMFIADAEYETDTVYDDANGDESEYYYDTDSEME